MPYENLNDLLQQDKKSKEYFMRLGECEQGELQMHTDYIHSKDDMMQWVKSIQNDRK